MIVRRLSIVAVPALVAFFAAQVEKASAQDAVAMRISQHAVFGDMLTDADGNTLYLFTNDELNVSNCSGGCATAWPPLLTTGDPILGEGLSENRLTTTEREDGSDQVVYNGWPLYYYQNDAVAGDTNGQDVGGVWFVVSASGGPIQTNAGVNLAENPDFGTILVEASGRTLYLFTTDESNKSNCSGGCATAWPPLLTIGDPTAGEGVTADRLGTITREDGSTQTTYNGWPLYYFPKDEGPGDTAGQYGQWFVVSTDGGPIHTNATVQTVADLALGTILVDASGRSLYLFTKDEPNASNCSGGCALAWPPLLTVDEATAEGSVASALLGTATRPDGYTQVTYDGAPLYYFANDEKPGDTNGQTVGDVWYVVSPTGEAVGLPEAEAPVLPSVGDAAVPSLVHLGLISSLMLIGIGGAFLIRGKPRVALR